MKRVENIDPDLGKCSNMWLNILLNWEHKTDEEWARKKNKICSRVQEMDFNLYICTFNLLIMIVPDGQPRMGPHFARHFVVDSPCPDTCFCISIHCMHAENLYFFECWYPCVLHCGYACTWSQRILESHVCWVMHVLLLSSNWGDKGQSGPTASLVPSYHRMAWVETSSVWSFIFL